MLKTLLPAARRCFVVSRDFKAVSIETYWFGLPPHGLSGKCRKCTESKIRAPIDRKIGRTTVTAGNYVSPSSGILATIVSQDPMHVAFAVSSQKAISLSRRAAETPVVIKIRLGDGHIYDQIGTLNFFDNVVAGNTDTITLRGDIRNLPIVSKENGGTTRELVDGRCYVTDSP
ncbi:HlyD family efflux transporter periplasmic adaptor subunit [Bradyrhizobium genosp. P]|uniref:HlyD family efflux transporter periplasmic adaptor subunit n=1 Tax=Bradyrhizobium genosp. P TaxID=83641 RepID=UPI003CE9C00D